MEIYSIAPSSGDLSTIVLSMDSKGIRGELYEICRVIAGYGYRLWLPDLYYRQGCLRFADRICGADRRRIEAARQQLTIDRFLSDFACLTAALRGRHGTSLERVGLLGFCSGSGYVYSAAARLGDQLGCAVVIDGCEKSDRHGSPWRACKVDLPVLMAFPERSDWRAIREIEAELVRAGARVTTHTLEGCGHGLCFPSWAGSVYSEAGRERAFELAREFLADSFGRTDSA